MKLRLSGAGDQFSILGLHHRNTHDSRGRGLVQPIGVPNLYGAPSIGPALGGANFNTSPYLVGYIANCSRQSAYSELRLRGGAAGKGEKTPIELPVSKRDQNLKRNPIVGLMFVLWKRYPLAKPL